MSRTRQDRAPGSREAVVAGRLVLALRTMKALNLRELTLEGVLETLAVSRSQAYEWASRLDAWEALQAGPGRPRKEKLEPEIAAPHHRDALLWLAFQVRDWLVEHPGAACAGPQRTAYSDAFRSMVLDLEASWETSGLSRPDLALGLGISPHTLESWRADAFRGHPQRRQVSETDDHAGIEAGVDSSSTEEPGDAEAEAPPSLPASQWAAPAARVLELWEQWRGPFGPFCASLKHHGLRISSAMVRSILQVSGARPVRRRRPPHPDAEAIRGELLRMFPNAQWNADGKSVGVRVGEQLYRFTFELVVDTGTSAHLGFSLRDHEDSQGLLLAMEQARESAGESPVGLLRDARKCNVAQAVETKLQDEGVISMVSTHRRPQNNAPAENSFSLLGHKLPVPVLPPPETLTPVELGRLVMSYMLLGVCIGRNHTPRSRLRDRTPATAFAQSRPTQEDKAQAREELHRLRRQVRSNARKDRFCGHPVTLAMVQESMTTLGLSDPKGQFAKAMARYGLEASLEGIATFQAKREAGTLPESHPERYLLGITRNVAFREEDLRTYEGLLALRAKAGDLLQAPLRDHDRSLLETLSGDEYLKAALHLAVTSLTQVDRTYWRHRTLEALASLPTPSRTESARHCARKVAARHKIPHRERDAFIAALARTVAPLAA